MTKMLTLPTLLVVGTISGCTSNLNFSVKEQWANAVQNLALAPVYPMREDVYIGTVRLVVDEERPFSLGSRNFGYIDVGFALARAYQDLPQYAQTADETTQTNANGVQTGTSWSQPTQPAIFTSAGSTPDRLRIAAIPGLSVVNINEADLGSAGPLGRLTAAFQQNSNLSIALGAVESVEIDDPLAYQIFFNEMHDQIYSSPSYRHAICASLNTLGTSETGTVNLRDIKIEMVTRVFYARSIHYSFGEDISAAINGSVGAGAPTAAQSLLIPQDGTEVAEGEPAAETQDAAAPATMQAVPSPGSTARVATRRDTGSTLTEVFERPLAFGVGKIAISPYEWGVRCDAEYRLSEDIIASRTSNGQPLVLAILFGESTTTSANTTTSTATTTSTTAGAATTTTLQPLNTTCQARVASGEITEERALALQQQGLC